MNNEAYIQLAIFYGGLSAFLVGAVAYSLRVSREVKRAVISNTSEAHRAVSPCVVNDDLYSEFRERAHLASSQIQTLLGDDPVLARNPELMSIYREALEKLEDLDQAAGRMGKQ